jgi:hypothetical protein
LFHRRRIAVVADQPEQTASRRGFRRRVDWRHAARLVAHGTSLTEAARVVGCSRNQLSRRRNHDPIFQGWVEESRRGADELGAPNAGLRRTLTAAIEAEVRAGNVRVILWLADRLKLLEPPSARTPDQALHDMLRGLSSDELQEFASLRDDG